MGCAWRQAKGIGVHGGSKIMITVLDDDCHDGADVVVMMMMTMMVTMLGDSQEVSWTTPRELPQAMV